LIWIQGIGKADLYGKTRLDIAFDSGFGDIELQS
jgi:hypothetical protein